MYLFLDSHFLLYRVHTWPVYMIKIKVAFLEGRLLSSHSEELKKILKKLWMDEKSRPPSKKPLLFWSCKQANCMFQKLKFAPKTFYKLEIRNVFESFKFNLIWLPEIEKQRTVNITSYQIMK